MKFKRIMAIVMVLMLTIVFVGCSSNKDSVRADVYKKEDQVTKGNEEKEVKDDKEVEQDNTEIKETEEHDKISIEIKNFDEVIEGVESEPVTYPVTVDTLGGQFTIEKEPMTIVSVGPNITEALYAVGAGDKVVGRTSYCNFPEEALEVAEIGNIQEPNIELIIELAPDMVIASTHFPQEAADKLNDAGVQTIALYEAESFEGVYTIIEKLGLVINRKAEANAVISYMQENVNEIVNGLDNVEEKPSVYYVVSYGNGADYTATGETFINQMIELAGGTNVAKDATGWSYSAEKLIEDDPDLILLSSWMYEGFMTTEPYTNLTAVKSEKVYIVDENIIQRQGPRLSEGLYEFAKNIHPEIIE